MKLKLKKFGDFGIQLKMSRGIALLQRLLKGMPMVLIIELLKVTAINA
jgi:hypothetical protein